MARGLAVWVVGTVLACAAIGIAYLPPRGLPEERALPGGGPPPSRERLRAGALALEWRAADRAVQIAEWRERLRAELTGRRAAGLGGPLLVVDTALAPAAREAVAKQLDGVWRTLGLGVSKISVAVVVGGEAPRVPVSPGRPARERNQAPAFLLPDSTDRHACITLLPVNWWGLQALGRRDPAPDPRLQGWLRSGLGPCAFYAGFGRPSREIEAWLRVRGFDVALAPVWDHAAPTTRTAPWYFDQAGYLGWAWQWIYSHPFEALACLGGREEGCRTSILAGSAARGPYVSTESWWRRRRGLVGAEMYLSDLLRDVGPERFRHFWTADVAVDSAFRGATGDDIGRWTRRWQGQLGVGLPLGPAAPLGAAVLGVLVAALGVVAAALHAERRTL